MDPWKTANGQNTCSNSTIFQPAARPGIFSSVTNNNLFGNKGGTSVNSAVLQPEISKPGRSSSGSIMNPMNPNGFGITGVNGINGRVTGQFQPSISSPLAPGSPAAFGRDNNNKYMNQGVGNGNYVQVPPLKSF